MIIRTYFLLLNKLVNMGINDKFRNVINSLVLSIICSKAKALF